MRSSLSERWRASSACSALSSWERRALAPPAASSREAGRGDLTLSNLLPGLGRQRPSLRQCIGHFLQSAQAVLVRRTVSSEGRAEARQVAGRVDLVSEELLKLAVRGRCLHDVGHFVSEQLELEVGERMGPRLAGLECRKRGSRGSGDTANARHG